MAQNVRPEELFHNNIKNIVYPLKLYMPGLSTVYFQTANHSCNNSTERMYHVNMIISVYESEIGIKWTKYITP